MPFGGASLVVDGVMYVKVVRRRYEIQKSSLYSVAERGLRKKEGGKRCQSGWR